MEILIIFGAILLATLICLIFRNRVVLEASSVIASIIAFVEALLVGLKISETGTYSPFPLLSVDAFGAIVMILIALVGVVATVYSVRYLREETKKQVI